MELLDSRMDFQGCKIALICGDKVLTIKQSVFMVGQLRQEQFDNITFGDEGQAYKLMNIEEFLKSKQAVPQLQGRLRDYLEESL